MTSPLDTKLDEIRALAEKATPVNAWYAHTEDATVRGPYNRWFKIVGPLDAHICGPHHDQKVRADSSDDIRYAAMALTMFPKLLAVIDELRRQRDEYLWKYDDETHEAYIKSDDQKAAEILGEV